MTLRGHPPSFDALDHGQAAFRWRLFHYVTLAAIGVFFLSTLREGHSWGDDFAQYLQHADNMAHGKGYAETGYIYNPQNAIVGPRAYPPGLPAALAPVVAIFGANLKACKALNVFLFLATLMLAGKLFASDLTRRNRWIWLTIVGFSPVFWEVKEGIASEHLFMPLWYATLLVAEAWYRRGRIIGNAIWHGGLLGGLLFATCATRSVGIVLLPVIVACEVLIARRATRVGITAISTAIALLMAQRFVLPASGSGYLEQLRGISVSTLLANAYADTTSFSLLWQNAHWDSVRRIAGAAFALLAAGGFLRTHLRRPTPLGLAMLAYFAMIVIWPSADGLRMVLPLLPAFVFYLLIGISSLSDLRLMTRASDSRPATESLSPPGLSSWNRARVATTSLLLFSIASFGAAYLRADYGPFHTGVDSPPAKELFDFVRTSTSPDDICLFFKPRALALYTGRKASAFPLGSDEQAFSQYADSIRASIIIVRRGAASLKNDDQTCEMRDWFATDELREVFGNSEFQVYRKSAFQAGDTR